MNAELVKQALLVVEHPNTLVNLVSKRVRQLNAGGGGLSRPLVKTVGNESLADIALRELIEGKMGWEMPELAPLVRPVRRKIKRK